MPDSQTPFDVAVVMPTILRPTLEEAVRSVYDQEFKGRGHLLVGVDKALGDSSLPDAIAALCPDHWTLTVLNLGYSTSVGHGGLYAAKDGGALRTILSYAANSRYVAYLDDDNWWAPNHLASLLAAVAGHDWAYSYRWFVDAASSLPLVVDRWESVGPGAGVFDTPFGGFVDPNTLLIDKMACEIWPLAAWTRPLAGDPHGKTADRNVFDALRRGFRGRRTGLATCYYRMDPGDGLHAKRESAIRQEMGAGS